jgi:hypothetical protein
VKNKPWLRGLLLLLAVSVVAFAAYRLGGCYYARVRGELPPAPAAAP